MAVEGVVLVGAMEAACVPSVNGMTLEWHGSLHVKVALYRGMLIPMGIPFSESADQ